MGTKLKTANGTGTSEDGKNNYALQYFRSEYEAHIVDKKCPAGVCKDLLTYRIVEDKCKGCTLCKRVCPVGAISGDVRNPHVIDPAKCIKCGACMGGCKFGAIVRE